MKYINKYLKKNNWNINGFEIHDFFNKEQIDKVFIAFYNRLLLAAYKLSINRKFEPIRSFSDFYLKDMCDLCKKIQIIDKKFLDYIINELRETPAFYNLISDKILSKASKILNCPVSLLKIHFDGILINMPSNKQRLYKFHSESHYYPFRKNFINLWMPIFFDKNEKNGAMIIKLKGHKEVYDFVEYSGFDKLHNNSKKNLNSQKISEETFFHQFEITEKQICKFESLLVNLKKNKVLLFHQNLPHSSRINISNKPSFALIARIYDYRKDLTLSDRTGVFPYTDNTGGYPGLRSFQN
jgi:hypothetical protein